MAKKQNSESPAANPRRRAPKTVPPAPPIDNAMAPPSMASSGNGDLSSNPVASSQHITREPSYDDIAQEAYLRYLRRGASDGRDFDDWLEAERELRRKG